jgi:hypothetical protein
LKRFLSLIGSLCAVLALAGAAHAGISFGVSEDRGKDSDPSGFFTTLVDVGLNQNRASISWDPAQPNVIQGQDQIAAWLPAAQAAGVRVVFSVSAKTARDLSAAGAPEQFAAFVRHVAETFPQVKDFVIGNEPNQPYFWLPQFDDLGRPVAAAAYEPVLARSYDALKAFDPTINVIGLGLSPRGNDNPNARTNKSRSPVRFLRDLGLAYRAGGRTKPLMDELAFHAYPLVNTDPPSTGYLWPNAGLPNLDRIKQAVWDAFNGTAQPTFAETGKSTRGTPLRLELDELGWEVAVLPPLAGLYFGTETKPTIDEPTQAEYYDESIRLAECDPSVSSLSFFLLTDEPDLTHWQSGLERVDGSHRPSYDRVKQTIAQTHGNCQGAPATWKHLTQVVSSFAAWGNLRRVRSRRTTRWSFLVGAGEQATFRAGIFPAGTSRSAIARRLAGGRPKPLLSALGTIKAKNRVVNFPRRRLVPGRYRYAILMRASMNPARKQVIVSSPFVVRR